MWLRAAPQHRYTHKHTHRGRRTGMRVPAPLPSVPQCRTLCQCAYNSQNMQHKPSMVLACPAHPQLHTKVLLVVVHGVAFRPLD